MFYTTLLLLATLELASARIAEESLMRELIAKKRVVQEAQDYGAAVDVMLGYPNQGSCELGQGFSFGSMGCAGSPIEPFSECSVLGDNLDLQPCSQLEKVVGTTTYYGNKVDSKSDLTSQIESSISAEGKGWGMSASVSASYMSKKQSTSNSVAFYLGQSGTWKEGHITNAPNLVLGSEQLELLTSDPEHFIKNYGRFYVSKIGYGGTFIGSFQFQSSMNSDSTSLQVAEDFSYDEMFSEKGTYDQNITSMSSYVTETIAIVFSGGSIKDYTDDSFTPYGMQKKFQSWVTDSWGVTGTPMTVTLSSWWDILAVQNALIALGNDTVTAMYSKSAPDSNVLTKISKEYVLTGSLLNAIENALTWDCATLSSTFKAALSSLKSSVDSHIVKISQLTEDQVYAIQQQVTDKNETWFQATNGDFGFQALVDSNDACTPCTLNGYAFSGTQLEKTKVSNYRSCEYLCQQNDDCVVWNEEGGECYLLSDFTNWGSKTSYKSGVQTCNCYTYGDYGTSNVKTMTGTVSHTSSEEDYTWTLKSNENIPSGDLAGCSAYPGEDIRNSKTKIDVCKLECIHYGSKCVGIVADEWGTMLKSSTSGSVTRSGFDTYTLKRKKNAAISSTKKCQEWCQSKGDACVGWTFCPKTSDSSLPAKCALFSDYTGGTTFGGFISGPRSCAYPLDA